MTGSNTGDGRRPDLSLVMPCYNEEEVIPFTIPRLLKAFEDAGHTLEIVAVDNGSHDRTGEVIAELAGEYPGIVPCRVEENVGYGFGLLSGIPAATADWVGMIPADGQVDAEDVVRLFEAAQATNGRVIAKVRRRFRMDGLTRKIVSICYNGFVWLLWPGLGSLDVNGNPRIMTRETLAALELESKDFLIDPEALIKARYMGLRILEMSVFARMRGGGLSHVRASTCWDFFVRLLRFRFTGELRAWKRGLVSAGQSRLTSSQARG
jgi:glycosyltransferase involved in cell wall biosynthesis